MRRSLAQLCHMEEAVRRQEMVAFGELLAHGHCRGKRTRVLPLSCPHPAVGTQGLKAGASSFQLALGLLAASCIAHAPPSILVLPFLLDGSKP